jgi:hypothetical protein
LNPDDVGLTITKTPTNPIAIAAHLLLPTISPRIKIDNNVLKIGDANVSDTVVARGKKCKLA